MSYFKDDEFKCKCGICPIKPPNAPLLSRLNALRASYGRPLFVSSGWRCDTQNAKVGGVKDSPHLGGYAVDLFCTSSKDRYNLLFHALGLFKRIGIGSTFIHVDTDPNKPQEVIWLYEH